ncbi:MAG: flagellar assembly peptidoglycan hydrolase FlgJ [Betaproteobacteria bacterium]|nr:flagellar assembly peptidoglycan hydrolase FlgJ [Betaproteobacteria bacterium]
MNTMQIDDALTQQRFAYDMQAVGDLRLQMKQDPQAGLKSAAQEFEAMLLSIMLKSMRSSLSQDGPFDSDTTRFYTQLYDQQLSQQLSKQGGLGVARMIEQQMQRFLPPSAGQAGEQAASGAIPKAAPVAWRQTTMPLNPLIGAERIAATAKAAAGTGDAADNAAAARREFVNNLWPHALEASRDTGIPAHFLVAQAALESGWGKREIPRADGTSSYNIFGIKAGKNWQGASTETQTTEVIDGQAQSLRDSFRAYGSYAEAFRDYASVLRSNPRFSEVLGQTNGTDFARNLQQAGYATDPMYADKLSRIISGTALRQALADQAA